MKLIMHTDCLYSNSSSVFFTTSILKVKRYTYMHLFIEGFLGLHVLTMLFLWFGCMCYELAPDLQTPRACSTVLRWCKILIGTKCTCIVQYTMFGSCTCMPSFCALFYTACESETSVLKIKLKEVSSQLQEHEKLSRVKSVELEQMKVSLRETAASLSGMHTKYIFYSTIQCIIDGTL